MDGLSPFNFFSDDASFDFHRQLSGGNHGDRLSSHTPPSTAQLQALLHHSPALRQPTLSPEDLQQLFAQQQALQQSQMVFHLQQQQQQQQQLPPQHLQQQQQPRQPQQQQRLPAPLPPQVPAPQPSFSSRAEEAVSSLLRAGEATRKRQKYQRSRLGCLTCKSRKLKCDEQMPVCNRCTTAKRDCRWTERQPPYETSPANSNGHPASSKRRLSESAKVEDGSQQQQLQDLQPVASSSRVTLDDLPVVLSQPGSALGKHLFSQASAARRPFQTAGIEAARPEPPPFVDLVPPDAKLAIMTSPSFLHPFFPSTEEKMLIHHYLHHTTRIIVARDSSINFWVTKHGPLAFSVAKGYSPACDALRNSLLLVGAVHLRYLSQTQGDPGAVTRLRARTVGMIKQVVQTGETAEDELLLCALLSCAVSCSLGGDEGWQELLQLASQLIKRNGGPRALLERAPRDRMSPIRFVLEQLATREVFGSLTTGTTPTLLGEGFAPWLFEMEKWSASEEERASIEIMFGLSRGMVDLIARVAALVARKHRTGYVVFEDEDLDSASPAGESTPYPSLSAEQEVERSKLEVEARNTILELQIWQTSEKFSPIHPRVQFGNSAHRLAMSLFILTNVFRVDRSDPRLTDGARAIIEVVKAAATTFPTLTWLTWPSLIAGLSCAPDSREDIRQLVSGFGEHAAFDNLWALTVLTEFWRRLDEGQSPSLREIIDALGLEPFFD